MTRGATSPGRFSTGTARIVCGRCLTSSARAATKTAPLRSRSRHPHRVRSAGTRRVAPGLPRSAVRAYGAATSMARSTRRRAWSRRSCASRRSLRDKKPITRRRSRRGTTGSRPTRSSTGWSAASRVAGTLSALSSPMDVRTTPVTTGSGDVGAEAALRVSEARFRALATASADVIFRTSPDWSEMRQLDGHDFLSDSPEPSDAWLTRYVHPDDRARVTAAIREAVQTRSTFELDHRVIRADGTLGWTFSRAVPLLDADGEIVEWIGAASDVTAAH